MMPTGNKNLLGGPCGALFDVDLSNVRSYVLDAGELDSLELIVDSGTNSYASWKVYGGFRSRDFHISAGRL